MNLRLLACLFLLLIPAMSAAAPARDFDPDAAVSRIQALLREHYVMRDKLDATVQALERRRGDYRALSDRARFAAAVTEDLRAASGDWHLSLQVRQSSSTRPSAEAWAAEEREREIAHNHGFAAAQILEGNVGYLRITEFAEPQRGLPTLIAAMRFVRQAPALIVDLRGNTGGYGGLAEYLASYWFDPQPVLLTTTRFRKPNDSLRQTFTLPAVDGARRTGTPLYVLVDAGTGSAAEWLAYTLQAFGKARIVGERSSGGANMNDYFDVDERLRLSVSVGQPIVPPTQSNWEGVGVQPDVASPSAQALDTALALARAQR